MTYDSLQDRLIKSNAAIIVSVARNGGMMARIMAPTPIPCRA